MKRRLRLRQPCIDDIADLVTENYSDLEDDSTEDDGNHDQSQEDTDVVENEDQDGDTEVDEDEDDNEDQDKEEDDNEDQDKEEDFHDPDNDDDSNDDDEYASIHNELGHVLNALSAMHDRVHDMQLRLRALITTTKRDAPSTSASTQKKRKLR